MINLNTNIFGNIKNLFTSIISTYNRNIINDNGIVEGLRCANNKVVELKRNNLSYYSEHSRDTFNLMGIVDASQSVSYDNIVSTIYNISTPSLLLIPNGVNYGKLYTTTPNINDFTFTSLDSGNRTITNRNGLLQRFRKNLINHSNGRSGFTPTTNFVVTNTTLNGSEAVILSATTTQNGVDYQIGLKSSQASLTLVSGVTYTFSFRVKPLDGANQFSYFLLPTGDDLASKQIGASFNVVTNTTSSNYTDNVTKIGRTVVNEGNGIYLCSETFVCNFNSTGRVATITLGFGNGLNTQIAGRNAIFGTIQLESSVIPTTIQHTTANINQPRINYSGSTSYLLLEPIRTNTILHSNDISMSGWNLNNAVYTAITSSLFNNIIDKSFIISLTGGTSGIRRFQSTSFQSGSTFTSSVFFKNVNLTSSRINISNGIDSELSTFWVFTASTPQFQGINNSGNFSNTTTSVERYIDDWFRIAITTRLGSSATQYNPSTLTFNNSAIGERYILGPHQIELGNFPTSQITTTTSTATRNGESFSISNVYTNNLITNAGGTWYISLINNFVYTPDQTITQQIGLGNGNIDNFWIGVDANNSRIRIAKQTSTTLAALYTTLTDNAKIAIKWNGTTADIFVNGVKVVTNTSFTQLALENLRVSLLYTPISIQAMALFSTPLTDNQCINLTT